MSRPRPIQKPYKELFITHPGAFDPYKEVSDESKDRLNGDVAFTDADIIRVIHPQRGIVQKMLNMFFRAVVEECNAKGIALYDPTGNAEQQLIGIIRRRTAPWSAPDGPLQGANPGGVIEVCGNAPNAPNVVSNPPSKVGGGRRGGRGGGGKTEKAKVSELGKLH